MEITIKVNHKIGDIVYLKTCSDQNEYIVIGYNITENIILYKLASGENGFTATGIELTTHKNKLKSLGVTPN